MKKEKQDKRISLGKLIEKQLLGKSELESRIEQWVYRKALKKQNKAR